MTQILQRLESGGLTQIQCWAISEAIEIAQRKWQCGEPVSLAEIEAPLEGGDLTPKQSRAIAKAIHMAHPREAVESSPRQ